MQITITRPINPSDGEVEPLLDAEPGLYVNHENPAVYHLVALTSGNAKRTITTFSYTDPDNEPSVISGQMNYFGRRADPRTKVDIAAG